jgi:hypothetical protein
LILYSFNSYAVSRDVYAEFRSVFFMERRDSSRLGSDRSLGVNSWRCAIHRVSAYDDGFLILYFFNRYAVSRDVYAEFRSVFSLERRDSSRLGSDRSLGVNSWRCAIHRVSDQIDALVSIHGEARFIASRH